MNEQLIAASRQALEALLDLSTMDTYQNEDDEVGRKVCCGEVSYRPHSPDCKTMEAITALRTAIEAAEKQEPLTDDYRIKYDRGCYKCRSQFCPGNCIDTIPPAATVQELTQMNGKQPPAPWNTPAAPVQEPVAVVSGYYGGQCVIQPLNPARVFNTGTAFYTTPPAAQRKPLTDEQILEHFRETIDTGSLLSFVDGVRFAESAHGIKEKNGGAA